MNLVNSLKRFTIVILLLIAVTFILVYTFDEFIAAPIKPSVLFSQTMKTVIVVGFGSLIIFFMRRSRALISKRVGSHPAAVFQFFMVLVVVIVMVFAVLSIFHVSSTTLLLSGGIVSITLGLVISTLVGNILAGTLVLMTNPFRVGDTVLVNNVPGKIVEITSLVTRIRNDIGGQIVIPNTAIVQGSVIVTKVPADGAPSHSRLPYSLGDRVYTTYMSGEGVVTELTPFHTKILLDSGRELAFLNNSVLAGSVAVAKISPEADDKLRFSFKTTSDADKMIEAIKKAVASSPLIFRSAPEVLYSSLDAKTVELEISCRVDPKKKPEAKDIILKTAYDLANKA